MSDLLQVLSDRFGLQSFRPMQEEAIRSVLSGKDALIVMPTGGGKSLCYQLPAMLIPGVTLVVSPLIALMKDQVDRLTKLGVPAAAINSSLHFNQARAMLERAQRGEIKVVFVAPERLESPRFRETLRELPISLLAIDEAHCTSEWGHDFRTSYRKIPESYEFFREGKRPPTIALTATATPEVREDIKRMLQLRDPFEVVTGFERENISYGVLREADKSSRLLDLVRSLNGGSAIIYTLTKPHATRIVELLASKEIRSASYHSGLTPELRKRVQERFLSGEMPVMVATSAFGMGIDKPDIRLVLHYEMPNSLESYYQESGRAGRDGNPAMAVLFHTHEDRRTNEYLLRLSAPTSGELTAVYRALHDLAMNGVGSVAPSTMTIDRAALLKRIPKPQASIERILEVLEESGYLRLHRLGERERNPKMQFIGSRGRLEEILFRANSPTLKTTLSALMRAGGADAFTREVAIDDVEFRRRNQLSTEDYQHAIRTLVGLGALRYVTPPKSSATLQNFTFDLLNERIAPQHLTLPLRQIEDRFEHAMNKFQAMNDYATKWRCRTTQIMEYFGERPIRPECGRCDVCAAKLRGAEPNRSAPLEQSMEPE